MGFVRIKCELKTAKMRASVLQLKHEQPKCQARALEVLLNGAGGDLLDSAPRDTNRYANAWAEAMNQTGLGPFEVRFPQPSRHAEKILATLWKQYSKLKRFRESVEAKGGDLQLKGKKKGQVTKRFVRLVEAEQRALKIFYAYKAGDKTALALSGSGAGMRIGKQRFDFKGRLLEVSLRPRIYGGRGSVLSVGLKKVQYRFRNMEPHSWWVERATKLVQRTVGKMRASGAYTLNREVKEAVRKVRAAG